MHASDPSVARSRPRRLPTLTVGVALALASSGVATAQASAASIGVGQGCVVNDNPYTGSSVVVIGSGFTPGDTISLQSATGGASGTATADANGNFSTTIVGPTLSTANPTAVLFTLTAADFMNPLAMNPTTTFYVANLAVTTNPHKARPPMKVTWLFSGFTGGAEIYAHYLHGKKVVATTRFGRAVGACGILKKKAALYPGHAEYGSYKVQIDDSRGYSPNSVPRFVGVLDTRLPL